MMGCECRGGFFALRDCDQPVATSCGTCGRGVCSRHLSPASGFTQCLDCWAQGHGDEQQKVADDGSVPAVDRSVADDAAYDDDWAYGYRHGFYRSGYAPIYFGSHSSRYYDTYDTRSFDDDYGDESGFSEGDGGFGDS
ncbi:MAG: hypothetical protein HYU52_04475 [Acidobacteria bacterium]|nr:hypothetical protein [Acidobacteriota bacterium]